MLKLRQFSIQFVNPNCNISKEIATKYREYLFANNINFMKRIWLHWT